VKNAATPHTRNYARGDVKKLQAPWKKLFADVSIFLLASTIRGALLAQSVQKDIIGPIKK